MKILILIILILLQAIKIPVLFLKGVLFFFYIAAAHSWYYINLIQRILHCKMYQFWKREKAIPKPIKVPVIEIIVDENVSVVGKTRTQFITELPKLKPVAPFHSEPMESESVSFVEEEPDINPDDIEVEDATSDLRDILKGEEPEMFSHEGDMPSDDLSSGVTIEQLTETYNTLTQDNTSPEKEDRAGNVIESLEGTEFFYMFLLEAECAAKAKLLMEKIREKHFRELPEDANNFNIDKYI